MALKLKPWHEAVQLRPEILSGKVSQAIFVADVYNVMMHDAPEIYQDPVQFFATTYPTAGLVQLVKDVVQRLADKSDKAVRQLSQVYGGGKTHSLVTLYHLVSDPDTLPPADSVNEFKAACNVEIPKSRVVVLPFDKIDQVKGMETISGVAGESKRDLHQPWSILAYQLAGADGLRLLTGGDDTERNSAPAEPLLVALLQRAQQDGRAVLILMDEVLMYARGSVEAGSLDGQDQSRLTQLTNFFQYLTQAAVKTPRCALVASLLANEMNRNDTIGKQILQDLSNIFRRESEGDIEPVAIKDIGAVLARRFFTMDSIQKDHRASVRAALTGIKALDATTQKQGEQAVETYAKSFPFHPDLNEVFAGRWTALRTFQRTRGALRIFADALRDAAAWGDPSPLVSVNVFLSKPDSEALSTASANLAGIAAENVTEGSQPNWSAILTKELEHARAIQSDLPSLAKYREVEQAIMATFLLSQPDGQRAGTADLLRLIGPTDPDRIELNKALLRWIDRSWYLDDATERASKSEKPGERPLPDHWRLGFVPNLNQIHHYAMDRVTNESVETHLDAEIRKNQALISHIPSSVVSYRIPEKPFDVRDDGALQFVVLGASACSEPGKVSKEADRYLKTKGPDRPRKCKNTIVCIVPRRDGIETARDIVKDLLAWDEVVKEPNDLDEIRKTTAKGNLATARKRVPDAIRQAYTLAAVWTTPLDVSAILSPLRTGRSSRRSRRSLRSTLSTPRSRRTPSCQGGRTTCGPKRKASGASSS